MSFSHVKAAHSIGVDRNACAVRGFCGSCIAVDDFAGLSRIRKTVHMPKPRPKHLNLAVIRFPVMAWVSGLHRASGALLFVLLPLLLWLWHQSIASRESFDAFRNVVAQPFTRLVLLALLWAYLHHICAGIRHLGLDLDLGTDLRPARVSGWVVIVVSLALTLVIGARLW
jgi:succinate dehydrogenase / fumarate reductase cytochrome b subunit